MRDSVTDADGKCAAGSGAGLSDNRQNQHPTPCHSRSGRWILQFARAITAQNPFN